MDYKFYYIRDKNNQPVITVCILKDNTGKFHRGVALCSKLDDINKELGRSRSIAHYRAIKAFYSKRDQLLVSRTVDDYFQISQNNNKNTILLINIISSDKLYKSQYDVICNHVERRLFRLETPLAMFRCNICDSLLLREELDLEIRIPNNCNSPCLVAACSNCGNIINFDTDAGIYHQE